LDKPLPHSRPSDVAANREARISGRQLLVLTYSGLWRLLTGLPFAAIGTGFAWTVTDWLGLVLGLPMMGVGIYASWRGFSFLGDALTRNVTYQNGKLECTTKTYKSSTYYYMVIGPVEAWISKKAYDALPVGLPCHVYYAAGSRHLLSVEPADLAEPHPSLRFGGDAAHAWDRLRWPWLVGTVAVLSLAAGAHFMIWAHPAQTYEVSGPISGYREVQGKHVDRYLSLEGYSSEYVLNDLESTSPPLPDLSNNIGEQVDLYVNSENDYRVLALRIREHVYAADLYAHPEHQFWTMIIAGLVVVLLSVATLAGILYWWLHFARNSVPSSALDPVRS
jgi:hypothetical protein